jgi:hypothetical protein
MTANETIADEALSHAVDLQRYSNAAVRKIISRLNETDKRLVAALNEALERLSPESFTVERLESLLFSVRTINREAFELIGRELTEELRSFTEYEAAYQRQALVSALPVQVSVASISPEIVYAAAIAKPFQGVFLKGVLKDIEEARAKKIRQAIAQGYTEGRTTNDIIREIRGTRAAGYSDGLMEVSRRDADAIVRTAIGHMARFTQDRFHEANSDIIKAVMWLSTLDLKTSPICRVRDRKLYKPVTHAPIGHSLPWLGGAGAAHYRCRSHATVVLKSWKEMGINIPEKDSETRASLDGQVPSETSYSQWLGKQSATRQTEVLGAKRAELLRSGKLKLEDMYSSKGVYLTLEELKAKL